MAISGSLYDNMGIMSALVSKIIEVFPTLFLVLILSALWKMFYEVVYNWHKYRETGAPSENVDDSTLQQNNNRINRHNRRVGISQQGNTEYIHCDFTISTV